MDVDLKRGFFTQNTILLCNFSRSVQYFNHMVSEIGLKNIIKRYKARVKGQI
jgi:hypothetical protein